MKLTEALFLWHQWRCAIWFARKCAANMGNQMIEWSGLLHTVRGDVWAVKLKMREQYGEVMWGYHKDRMTFFRRILDA